MAQQKIVSREYKVMLRPTRFCGDDRALLSAAHALWRDLSKGVAAVVVDARGDLDRITLRRLIRFLDTKRQHLNRSGYILRERREIGDRDRQITLKFRHLDRYVSQNRKMDAFPRTGGRTKFEEDIKSPFVSLYSFSTTVVTGEKTPVARLKHAARLFPDLRRRVDDFQPTAALASVRSFTAREVIVAGASLQIGKSPEMEAECALIVWYDADRAPQRPVAVELSYRYAKKDERYGGGMSRRAFDVFHRLPETLRAWIDPRSRTKTAFVYQ